MSSTTLLMGMTVHIMIRSPCQQQRSHCNSIPTSQNTFPHLQCEREGSASCHMLWPMCLHTQQALLHNHSRQLKHGLYILRRRRGCLHCCHCCHSSRRRRTAAATAATAVAGLCWGPTLPGQFESAHGGGLCCLSCWQQLQQQAVDAAGAGC
jgi:hypothetical protein